ncbi:MAG: leucyl/phenylalanyl-tRNA--protein transferase [Planctomycetota bacterium]|nr:leucyl/phenylalanyl-tRNA--protein transferase [Planctomycetota bacterium]
MSDRARHSPSAITPAQRAVLDAVLAMYRQGWFPMHDDRSGGLRWVQPRKRAVIPLDHRFHVPRSLRARIRAGRFRITSDADFPRVVRACAQPRPERPSTWLDDDIVALFDLLHRAGHAHSVEAWLPGPGAPAPAAPGAIVGGLYGLCVGSVFCGESMFSRPDLGGTDASKVCLVRLVEHLRARGFTMLDSQLANPHLDQFGAIEIDAREYQAHLDSAALEPRAWTPFN